MTTKPAHPSTNTSPRDHSTLTSDHRGVTPEQLEQARRDNEIAWLRRERVRYMAIVRELATSPCDCRGAPESGCIHTKAAKLDADSAANEGRLAPTGQQG